MPIDSNHGIYRDSRVCIAAVETKAGVGGGAWERIGEFAGSSIDKRAVPVKNESTSTREP